MDTTVAVTDCCSYTWLQCRHWKVRSSSCQVACRESMLRRMFWTNSSLSCMYAILSFTIYLLHVCFPKSM